MSQQSFSIRFYLITERAKSNKIPIYCRIIIDRKKSEFFTQLYTTKIKWDPVLMRVKGNPESNAVLSGIESKIRSIYNQATIENKSTSAYTVKLKFLGKDQSKQTLIDYFMQFETEIAELTDQYSISTIKKYKTTRKHLTNFLKINNKTFMQISALRLKDINEFEFYLRTKCELSINTTTKNLKQLKTVINRAIKFDVISENPFANYKFKLQDTHRTFLTSEEFELIEKFNTDNDSLMRVADCFKFACYTGLRYSDMIALKNSDIYKNKKGETWISITMQKTNQPLSIPILNSAVDILNKYSELSKLTGRPLPVISNQKINSYLKVIAELVGLKKKLTFHVARHTFATTMTLSNKVPLEVVSKLLGHKDIKSTQHYAKITPDRLSESIQELNKSHGSKK